MIPTQIVLHQKSKTLEVIFDTGERFMLPCEYLRVFSPSAEARVLRGKAEVNIVAIEPVGQYAIKPIFDDGHCSGIYSWKTLYDLGINYQKNWGK